MLRGQDETVDNIKVAGTNVEFSVYGSVSYIGTDDSVLSEQPSVYSFQITIGNEAIPEVVVPDPEHTTYPNWEKIVRFASTHFPDSTTPVTLRVYYRIYDSTSGAYHTYYQDADLKHYVIANRITLLATTVAGSGPGEEGELGADQDVVAADGVSDALSQLSQTNISMYPNTIDGAKSMAASDVTDSLKTSTLFFAFTHGNELGFTPSTTVDTTITWSQVFGALAENPTSPPQFLDILYACSTLADTGQIEAPEDFEIETLTEGILSDRAYCGFPLDVSTTTSMGKLNNHSHDLLSNLLAGATVNDSVYYANLHDTPYSVKLDSNGDPVNDSFGFPEYVNNFMVAKGDADTRLINVYLSDAERTAYPGVVNQWYFVY